MIPVKYSNKDILTAIEAGTPKSTIAWNMIENPKKIFLKGEHLIYSGLQIGDISSAGWLQNFGGYHTGALQNDAMLGNGNLFAYDLAVSPEDGTLALKKSDSFSWTHIATATLSENKKNTEPDEEGNEAEASDWSTLAKNHAALFDFDNALSAGQKALDLAPEDCNLWLSMGAIHHIKGDNTKAKEFYHQASIRYHNWWDRSLDERLEIKKEQGAIPSEEAKALKEEQKAKDPSTSPVWHHYQASQCHISDGMVALAALSQGNYTEIAQLYAQLDLDPRLAIIQGNAALVSGDLDLAESAYRQALLLESAPMVAPRYGLALFFADQGEWRFADPLFQEAFDLFPVDSIGASLWFDNARANGEDTIKKAMALQEKYPQSYTPQFLLLREAVILQNQEIIDSMSPLIDFPEKLFFFASSKKIMQTLIT